MAKTIFNTTEKSNFILNMKTEDYHRCNLRILQLFLILMPLFSLPLEFAKVYSVPGMALAIAGVFAVVFVFIGFMKRVTPRHLWFPAILLGGMVIWGSVSLYQSYDYNISLLGFDGRNEGLLSVLFYGCFFLLGAQLGTDANRQKLLNAMLCMGLAECAWALVQTLPFSADISYYTNLEPLLLFRVCLPSGLTGSPIFLATLLVMLTFPAILGAVFAEQKRAFYLVCASVFTLVAIRTQCLIGLAGTAVSIALALLYAAVRKSGKRMMPATLAVLAAFVLGFVWSTFSPAIYGTTSRATGTEMSVENSYALYDGGIIWEDCSYRLAASGYYVRSGSNNPNGHFDINSLPETYGYLWRSSAKIAGKYPLVGSGPDNLVYPQLYQSLVIASNPNTFDRTYDYYLHLAATMGVPMLVLFAVLMVLTVKRGIQKQNRTCWLHTALLGTVLLYLLMMVIGSSSITVTPLFWALAGCCAGFQKEE